MCWADEMMPKRENGYAANRRLTHDNVGFIISFIIIYHETYTVHVHAGAIRNRVNVRFIRTYER